jgi:hypothetical protein
MRRQPSPAWWPHAAFGAVMTLAIPLTYLFTASDRLATFGDDSGSYLTLAHYFAGASGNPFVAQWAAFHSHFPPLFPLLLTLSGGVHDYRIAYALVATFALAALPVFYRYAALQLGRNDAAVALVALFVLAPTAWIAVKGILSESLFLLATMSALLHHELRMARPQPRAGDRIVFGILLGLACLTRMLGLALVLAWIAHAAIDSARARRMPRAVELLPLVPVALLLGSWYLLRPTGSYDTYGATMLEMLTSWAGRPMLFLGASLDALVSAWVATFMAQETVGPAAKIVFSLLGIVALAGLALRLARNRLDAWYVFISIAIIFPWVFGPENTRRLLYPIVPLLLICMADALRALAIVLRWKSFGRMLLYGTVAAADLALSLPALALIAARSADHERVVPGYAYEYRDMVESYEIVDARAARELSQLVVALLGGLETIDHVTPPDARVMWMRPEYVGLLGHRQGVPYLYRWKPREIAENVRGSKAGYVVVTSLYKNDLEHMDGNPRVDTSAYAHPVLSQRGFALMQVDPAALSRYLAEPRPAR